MWIKPDFTRQFSAAFRKYSLWHERDISHSSVERIILPDCFILTDYLLHTFQRLLDNLVVYPENMRKIWRKVEVWFFRENTSGANQKGLTREDAYALVQHCAMKTWEDESLSFRGSQNDSSIREYFSEELNLFDYNYFLRQVDFILKRAGIEG